MHSFTSSPSYSLCGPLQDYSCHWSPKLQKVSFRIVIHFFFSFFFYYYYYSQVTWAFFHWNAIFVPHDIRTRNSHSKACQLQRAATVHISVCQILTQPGVFSRCREWNKNKKRYELEVLFRYYCYSDCEVLQDCFLCSCLWQPNSSMPGYHMTTLSWNDNFYLGTSADYMIHGNAVSIISNYKKKCNQLLISSCNLPSTISAALLSSTLLWSLYAWHL